MDLRALPNVHYRGINEMPVLDTSHISSTPALYSLLFKASYFFPWRCCLNYPYTRSHKYSTTLSSSSSKPAATPAIPFMEGTAHFHGFWLMQGLSCLGWFCSHTDTGYNFAATSLSIRQTASLPRPTKIDVRQFDWI
jgi:hypothetical protein